LPKEVEFSTSFVFKLIFNLELLIPLSRLSNKNMKPNNLINELSPYLQQHAFNPVDWYPWNDKAFQKAIDENKPIFLSIGYSTCHWCHVMEKESFEDEEIANILNKYFISIKVDREERPDIDSIYMTTCQLMTGHGGWPLSIFLTPNKKPFFAGTYFPKENRYGRIGFKDLLLRIKEAWENNLTDIIKSSDEITNSLNQLFVKTETSPINERILDKAFKYFQTTFDNVHGGFGNAPKFPSPHNLIFLLSYWNNKTNSESLNMVLDTLEKMRLGGMYDQIGFGFHRYSTDKHWLVPHFEKMLYDQALLIIAYSFAFQITKKDFFKTTVYEIVEYLTLKMKSNDGAYFSAEDADSEGEEGKFYLWTYDELKNLLSDDEFLLASKFFNIKKYGNYFDEITHTENGKNILHQTYSFEEYSKLNNINLDQLKDKIISIRIKIYNQRENRIHPFKDEKILTDWNSLLIASFSIAGRIFQDDNLLDNAKKIIDFIENKMKSESGVLLHRYKNGKADINATLDDYAFYIWGLIEFYQSTFNFNIVDKISFYVDQSISKFYDEENGGFFLADKNSTDLIIKTKDMYDGAIPSGNSVMIYNLIKLNSILFQNKYNHVIEKTFNYFSNQLAQSPASSTFLLLSYMNYIFPKELVIIYKDEFELNEIKKTIFNNFLPLTTINAFHVNNKPDNFKSYELLNEKMTYYYCSNFNCKMPTNNFSEILSIDN
jgi:uncharacterized protein YyaL (SSP411 family)